MYSLDLGSTSISRTCRCMRDQFLGVEDLLERVDRVDALLAVQDLHLVGGRGIAQADVEHEAVELRLRQREGALVLDGVLRRHAPGTGRGSGCVTPSTVICRSSIASSSADWVFGVARLISSASTNWPMIGPGRNSNSPVRWLIHRDAGDVARQQVGRELDALEGAADRARDGLRQDRLADARHVLDQDMALAQHGDQREAHGIVLADDHALDVVDDPLARLADRVYGNHLAIFYCHCRLRRAGINVQSS